MNSIDTFTSTSMREIEMRVERACLTDFGLNKIKYVLERSIKLMNKLFVLTDIELSSLVKLLSLTRLNTSPFISCHSNVNWQNITLSLTHRNVNNKLSTIFC